MSEFKLVGHPVFQPRSCALCGSFEGPMVDTELDIVNYGHVYLCAHTERRGGCVRGLAAKDGMVPIELLAEAQVVQAQSAAYIAELEARTVEVVPLSEVREAMVAGIVSAGDE